jgi:RNA polymerase sigma-70 factor (sigma-E family)
VEFEDYVAERRQALFRFAVVLSGDPVLADDILADVLGTAYERWAQVGAADNVHAYVRRMVVNEYLSWRRRRARLSVRADLADVLAPTADHADAHAEHAQLVVELRTLPPKQRAAVVLRYYEGLPFVEIAALLGSGENAIRSNISRALQKLRIQLTEEPDESGRAFRRTQEARP